MKLVNNINPNIFREYDIRGIVGSALNEDVSYTIGKSFGSKLIDLGKRICVIGHDNRLSGEDLTKALLKGITEAGVDVVYLGLTTTPMYYYAMIYKNIDAGIMVTASHNPKDYNGFKIAFDNTGNICGQTIYDFRDYTSKLNFHDGKGTVEECSVFKEYLKLLKDSTSITKRLKVVIDPGNGATAPFIEDILNMFDLDYRIINGESDGSFPNHIPDPAEEENMTMLKEAVLEEHADVGIAFDGDGDRVGIIDEKGQFISADLYMIMMIRDIFKNNSNKKVLFDVKCSKTLEDEINKLGGSYILYRVGNSYTKRATRENNCIFGGELSGHIYFRDKFLGFDSGIYAGLRMLEVLSKNNCTCSELLKGINKYYSTPEEKISCSDDNKFKIIDEIKEYCQNKNYKINDIDGVRVDFDNGWALVRASNTGPHITTRFEGKTKEDLNTIENEFKEILKGYLK